MFVFGDLVVAAANILDYILGIYKWILIITVLLTGSTPILIIQLSAFSMRQQSRCSDRYAD